MNSYKIMTCRDTVNLTLNKCSPQLSTVIIIPYQVCQNSSNFKFNHTQIHITHSGLVFLNNAKFMHNLVSYLLGTHAINDSSLENDKTEEKKTSAPPQSSDCWQRWHKTTADVGTDLPLMCPLSAPHLALICPTSGPDLPLICPLSVSYLPLNIG